MSDFLSPEHDDTPPDALGTARGILIIASRLGHSALAFRDARGAHEIFACAARTIVIGATASPAVLLQLKSAVEKADLEPSAEDRAAVLSAAITELLGEVVEDDEEPDGRQLDHIKQFMASAISLGAPAYNHGLHRGCYEVYAAAARIATLRWLAMKPIHDRLAVAQAAALTVQDETRKAWLLREAFDEVLALDSRPKRSTISLREMRLLISMAIQIGAPVYNSGDRRGCFEIYAAVARLLVQVVAPDRGEGAALRTVLQTAALESDITEQAWMLRRAFDAILSQADDAGE